jgi:hypothetical protein
MKRHEPDTVSLAWGLFFLLLAAAWAIAKMVDFDLPSIGWIFAILLVLIGAVGLISAFRPKPIRQL